MSNKIIIAIDGHSSCGKSTLAKDLAKTLNYIYVDTGAMYRAVALFALNQGLITNNKLNNTTQLKQLLPEISIGFKKDESGSVRTLLNNKDVEDEIRNMTISNIVSNISSFDFVRKKLVSAQQELGKEKGIVMDGRDIGTVVFPNAELKIFLTASPKIRAQRRFDELTAKGDKIVFDDVLENIITRDHNDETRKISPLKKADDAVTLDNSELSPKEQLAFVINLI